MDTAHRSLSSSLQLSFRALQAVMIVLVVLYLLSGLKTVEDAQTGVSTLFGSITSEDGLSPGLQTNWPPPIGGYVVFEAQNRKADIGTVFKPRIDARLNQQQRISKSSASDGLIPGRDGSLITADGDLAHIEVQAEWEIVDPIRYANSCQDATGSEFVDLALERATVQVVSTENLEELLDMPLEELRHLLRNEAQQTLTSLQCGIRIADVIIPSEPEPPFYIQKSYDAFDSAKINAETLVEQATAESHEMLIEAIGSSYEELLGLINNYEAAVEKGNKTDVTTRLEDIEVFLQSGETSGKVANKLAIAKSYRSAVELTLGQDAKRFLSILPRYREHPELVIQNKWLEMYANVLEQPDLETIFVPEFIETVKLALSGSDEIAQLRHRNLLKKKEFKALTEGMDLLNPWILRARDMDFSGPTRELSIQGGTVRGRE
jgi:regulator of protease activity HflC (stomatin/prohibitin superfamily)